MNVKIMRGIPGSGKSTYAKNLLSGDIQADIVSADNFFMVEGIYAFDAQKLGLAHKTCMKNFLFYVNQKVPLIIVDNTNINIEDMAPYIAVGEAMDYDVEILQVNVDPEIAASRNVHSVPRNRILDMHRRLNSIVIPRRWNRTFVP